MKEDEYVSVSNLMRIRLAQSIIAEALFYEDPNKTRQMSVIQNLQLMIDHIYKNEINIEDEE